MKRVATANPQFRVGIVCHADEATVVAGSGSGSGSGQWTITPEALRPAIAEIAVEKRLGEAAGTFVLTLLPRRVELAGGGISSFHDVIQPMDYVEIEMWVPPREPRVVMRGFVDTIVERTTWESGRPVRQILVAGRDWGRILLDAKLWWIDARTEGLKLMELWRLARARLTEWAGPDAQEPIVPAPEQQPKTNTFPYSPNLVMRTAWEAFVVPRLDDLMQFYPGTSVQRLALAVEVDQESEVLRTYDPMFYFSKISPMMDLWSVMHLYAHAPWRELFIDEDPFAPFLVYRPAPWLDVKGDWIQGQPTKSVETHTIDDVDVISRSLSRTDQGLANYFVTLPEGWDQLAAMAELSPAQFEGVLLGALKQQDIEKDDGRPRRRTIPADGQRFKGNPYILDTEAFSYHLFGLRTAKYTTPYFDIERPQAGDISERIRQIAEQGVTHNVQLAQAFGHSPWLEAGEFQLPGDERIRPGHYLNVAMAREPGEPALYYVVGISHRFRQPTGRGDGTFRTGVAVSRGRGHLERTRVGTGR